MIDWEFPFPAALIKQYYEEGEMYGVYSIINDNKIIVGALRLGYSPNPSIWPDGNRALYVNKLAVGNVARGGNIFLNTILPSIRDMAKSSGLGEIRLDCLAENKRLSRFYKRWLDYKGDIHIISLNDNKILLSRFSTKTF